VSPSGQYTALLEDDQLLQLLTADGGEASPPAATAKAGDTCPMLLAWAKGTERLACVANISNGADGTEHGEVRIFDLKPNSDSLEMTTLTGFCAEDTSVVSAASCTALLHGYGYGTEQASGVARAFSTSGRWFVFARQISGATYLYWSDLNRQPVALTGSTHLADDELSAATYLAFSPDDRLLVLKRGGTLSLADLTQTGLFKTLSSGLAVGEVCSEDFPKAPDSYCGDTALAAPLVWSPDSKTLAYRTSATLRVTDVSAFPKSAEFLLPAPECGETCSAQFAFQPHPDN